MTTAKTMEDLAEQVSLRIQDRLDCPVCGGSGVEYDDTGVPGCGYPHSCSACEKRREDEWKGERLVALERKVAELRASRDHVVDAAVELVHGITATHFNPKNMEDAMRAVRLAVNATGTNDNAAACRDDLSPLGVVRLRDRVRELEAENADLRARLAAAELRAVRPLHDRTDEELRLLDAMGQRMSSAALRESDARLPHISGPRGARVTSSQSAYWFGAGEILCDLIGAERRARREGKSP